MHVLLSQSPQSVATGRTHAPPPHPAPQLGRKHSGIPGFLLHLPKKKLFSIENLSKRSTTLQVLLYLSAPREVGETGVRGHGTGAPAVAPSTPAHVFGTCVFPAINPVPMGHPDRARAHGGCRAPTTVRSNRACWRRVVLEEMGRFFVLRAGVHWTKTGAMLLPCRRRLAGPGHRCPRLACAGCARDTTTSRRASVCSPAGPDTRRPLVVAYGARAHIRHILCCLRAPAHTPGQRCPARKYDTGLPPRRRRRVYRHTVARPPLAGRGGARTHQEEDGVRDGGTQGGGWEESRDNTAPGGLALVGLVPAAGDIRNTGGAGGWGDWTEHASGGESGCARTRQREWKRGGGWGAGGGAEKLDVHRVIVLLITVRFRMEQSSNSPAEFPENKLALGSWWPGHSVLRRHCTA